MHPTLEALYVTNELVDGICDPTIGWDFAILVDSYALYYQTVDISESEKSLQFIVKDVFVSDFVELLQFKDAKVHRCDTSCNCSIIEIYHNTLEDMIEHLLLIPRKLRDFAEFNSQRWAEILE